MGFGKIFLTSNWTIKSKVIKSSLSKVTLKMYGTQRKRIYIKLINSALVRKDKMFFSEIQECEEEKCKG